MNKLQQQKDLFSLIRHISPIHSKFFVISCLNPRVTSDFVFGMKCSSSNLSIKFIIDIPLIES